MDKMTNPTRALAIPLTPRAGQGRGQGRLLGGLVLLTVLALAPRMGLAAGDLSRENVTEVRIEMGSSDDGMYLKPDNYEFETGKAYKLVLVNVDEIKHEIALNEMGERIFTRKIEIADDAGELVAEIKGTIREVEVGPGKTVEWFIVPVQTTEDPVEITCELPGHYESGMHATATIR